MKFFFLDKLEETISLYPNSVAISYEGETFTYLELEKQITRISLILIENGIKEGDRILLWMKKSPDYIFCLLAIWKIKAVFLPIDERTPLDRVEWIYQDANAKALLTNLENIIWKTSSLRLPDFNLQLFLNKNNSFVGNSKLDEAYIIYTSGSTGKPKGVLLSHEGIVNFLETQLNIFQVKQTSKVLQYLSIGFDASISEIGISLLSGGELIIENEKSLKEIQILVRILAYKRITHICLPPSLLPLIPIETMPESLETIIIGGEVCPIPTIREWVKKFRIINVYGPTEATVCSSLIQCEANWSKPLIGLPIPNRNLYILDENKKQVKEGEEGELYLGGVGLALEYINQKKLTEEKFIFYNGERIYKTGDKVLFHSWEEIEFIGRLDRQFKLRGNLIEPYEIERVLVSEKEIRFAHVAKKNTRREILVAYLVLEESQIFNQKFILDLKKKMIRLLPKWMIPERFELLAKIPFNLNEKLDLKTISDLEIKRPSYLGDYNPPTNTLERKAVSILEKLLLFQPIGIDDDFFLLGGDSLSLISFITECSLIGINLSTEKWIQNPTIRHLVTELNSNTVERSIFFLKKEAILPTNIVKQIQEVGIVAEKFSKILFIGASGFLGSRVLHRLAVSKDLEIYCLVRTIPKAIEQIETYLSKQNLKLDQNRLHFIEGDITKKEFGISNAKWNHLANEIDTVFHFAAEVNLILPYSHLKKSNVNGTLEVLKFCITKKLKELHYASTLSVFVSSDDPREIFSEEGIEYASEVYGGYAQSKWVSEKILLNALEAGFQSIKIYRFGLITGDSNTGFSKQNDFFSLFLIFLEKYRVLPDSQNINLKVDVTPVDYAANQCISLSRLNTSSKIFHVANPNLLSLNDLVSYFEKMGKPIQIIPKKEFLELINNLENTSKYFYLALARILLKEEAYNFVYPLDLFQATNRKFDFKNSKNISHEKCPVADQDLIASYMAFLKN